MGDLGAQRIHQGGLLVVVAAAAEGGQDHQLLRVAVRGPAEVLDPADRGDLAKLNLQVAECSDIGGGQRRAGARGYHRQRQQVRRAERRRERRRMRARRAGGQELGVVVLGHAR